MIQNTKGGRHIAWTGPCHQRGPLVGDHSRHIGGFRRHTALDLSGDSVSRGIRKRIAAFEKLSEKPFEDDRQYLLLDDDIRPGRGARRRRRAAALGAAAMISGA